MINAQSWLHSPLTLGREETLGFMERPLGVFMDIHEYSDTTGEGGWRGPMIQTQGSWVMRLFALSLVLVYTLTIIQALRSQPPSWIPSNCLLLGRPASDPSRELKSSPCHHFFSFGPSDLLAVSLLLHPWRWRLAL